MDELKQYNVCNPYLFDLFRFESHYFEFLFDIFLHFSVPFFFTLKINKIFPSFLNFFGFIFFRIVF